MGWTRGAAECGETGAEVCMRGGVCIDLDQSWACDRAWGGDSGEDFADVLDCAGAVYGFDADDRVGDEGEEEVWAGGTGQARDGGRGEANYSGNRRERDCGWGPGGASGLWGEDFCAA